MLIYLCVFLPAVLSVCIYEKLTKEELPVKCWLYMYCTSLVLINLVCWVILRFLAGILVIDIYALGTLIRYMILALCAAVTFAVFAGLMKKTVKVRVEENE